MEYTISEIAKMMGVSTHTLRYYDKEGLFPSVKMLFINLNNVIFNYKHQINLCYTIK